MTKKDFTEGLDRNDTYCYGGDLSFYLQEDGDVKLEIGGHANFLDEAEEKAYWKMVGEVDDPDDYYDDCMYRDGTFIVPSSKLKDLIYFF